MPRMVAADAGWCRHFGKAGVKGDKERRAIKRSERNKAKKDIRREYK